MERWTHILLDQMPVQREVTQEDLAKLLEYQCRGYDVPLSVALVMIDGINDSQAKLEKMMEELFNLDQDVSLDMDEMDRDDLEFFAATITANLFLANFYKFPLLYIQARITTGEFIDNPVENIFNEIPNAIHGFYRYIYGPISGADDLELEKKEQVAHAEWVLTPFILSQIYSENSDPLKFIDKISELSLKQDSHEISRLGLERGRERFINLLVALSGPSN